MVVVDGPHSFSDFSWSPLFFRFELTSYILLLESDFGLEDTGSKSWIL